MIMIESEGITENMKTWRTDVLAKIISALGLEKPMLEAADPEVFFSASICWNVRAKRTD